jgi:hypothetical protein
LTLSKNVNNKKCAPKLKFFNEKKIEKDSDNFWYRKLTLKVKRLGDFALFDTSPLTQFSNCWKPKANFLRACQHFISYDNEIFLRMPTLKYYWCKMYLILYPPLGNLTTNVAIMYIDFHGFYRRNLPWISNMELLRRNDALCSSLSAHITQYGTYDGENSYPLYRRDKE